MANERRNVMNTCWACGRPTAHDYTPDIVIGVGCRRCAARAIKQASDALRVENWGVYRA